MSKIDDELTRRFHRAERPVDAEELFEGLRRRRSHRERIRRVQAGLLAFTVLAATASGFVALRHAFEGNRGTRVASELPANGRIVFSSDVQDGDRFTVHLFSMEPDISAPMQLTEGNSGNWSADVSPDGGRIVFTHDSYDSGEVVIATMTINGGKLSKLTDPVLKASNPTWSPDGTRIAFTGGRKQSQRIYVMNADGSDPHPITGDGIFLPEDPAWSPDGSLIAFRGSPTPPPAPEGPTTPDIYTIEPDGQHPANITNSPAAESQPAWSRDGGRIAYTYDNLPDDHVLDIVVRRLSDGAETILTDGPELDADPVWSPDGQFILFSRQPVVNGRFELWRIRADGSARTMLTVGGYGASWQPIPREAMSPTPVTSPSPEQASRDIGLGYPLCNIEKLGGIDWYSDGTDGAAWTGTPLTDGGRCPSSLDAPSIVAVDLDGDGTAESAGQPLSGSCLLCRPFDTADLNGDGVLELVVLDVASSTPSYSLYEVSVPTSERSPGVYALFVAPPGAPRANLPANEQLRFIVGGDEGFSGGLRCENYPDAPIIEYTWMFGEVDAQTDLEVHQTRLVLREGGAFHVLETNDFKIPRSAKMPKLISTEPACGVDFHPDA
jgi:Tol biopolymer transport system component